MTPAERDEVLTIEQAADLAARLDAAMGDDRPAPTVDVQPLPVLDLDALAEAERAMTAGPWKFANGTACGIVGHDNRDLKAWHWHKSGDGADRRGVVAMRNAAPHLIAEARAVVALRAEAVVQARKNREALRDLAAAQDETERLRAQICRLVSGQAIESDHLCQHHDADVAALARLAEAKQLGLEAVRLAESADLDAMASPRGAGGCGAATRHTNDIAAARAALEAL